MNIAQLARDLELDEEEYRAILEMFVEASRSDIAAIKAAVAHGDAMAASRAAHSLKGAAASLGLSDLSDMAREIEEKGRDSRLHETHLAVRSLEEHCAAVERFLMDGRAPSHAGESAVDGNQTTDGAKTPEEILKK